MGYKPREFAGQMNLAYSNGWGIVRTIIDLVRGMSAGEPSDKKYVLVKDPNKPLIRLYDVPMSTFEEDDDMGLTVATDGRDDDDE